MILVPLPVIWVINWVLHRVFHWPLLAVGVVFVVLWFLLGRLALRLYDRRVQTTPPENQGPAA